MFLIIGVLISFLSSMARYILTTPLSTVASESAYSIGRREFDAFHSPLEPHSTSCHLPKKLGVWARR